MNKTIILASGSPRRYELLTMVGLSPIVIPSDIDETQLPSESVVDYVKRLSIEKAVHVKNHLSDDLKKHAYPILGADTTVTLNGEVFGKPEDTADAKRIISALSGNVHTVITGFTIYNPKKDQFITDTSETKVKFKAMIESEIDWYVSTGESFGKSGAFALQGKGAFMIEWIHGSYSNVIGLPVERVIDLLREHDLVQLF